MKRIVPFLLPLFILSACSGSRRAVSTTPATDRTTYIEKYKDLAIKEMRRSGVPASITMAQALLESDNGNSRLAREANNHFGIKCHREWKGGKIYHDDDARNECFRKYRTVYESYIDHSDFLRAGSRYSFLFELDPTDYHAWARGLKAAGYATNRHYDNLLVRIIEENRLHLLDRGVDISLQIPPDTGFSPEGGSPVTEGEGEYEFTVSLASRQIFQNNRIDYILAEAGDTYPGLAREFNLMPWEIYRYNEITRDSVPVEGQMVYLQPKRNRAEPGKDFHTLREGENLYTISQLYGVKLKKLYRMNGLEEGTEPEAGTRISLRGNSGFNDLF